jgi:hypothetical protein
LLEEETREAGAFKAPSKGKDIERQACIHTAEPKTRADSDEENDPKEETEGAKETRVKGETKVSRGED